MNQLQVFENELFKVSARHEGEQILFDVEQVAKSLGITQGKGNKEYVRWERVNDYLPSNSPLVGKGDLIPEPLVYKLAFKAQNEVAEKFQDWLAIEVIPSIRKTGGYQAKPKSQAELIAMMAQHNVEQERRLSKVELRLVETERKQDNITEVLSLNPTEWRKKVTNIVRQIGLSLGGGSFYQQIWNESYELLEQRGRCDLGIRVTNKRRRMMDEGVRRSDINKVGKLDVIADDSRLTEIYLAIIKEMAIKYHVDYKQIS